MGAVFILCLMACQSLGLAWGSTMAMGLRPGPEALPVTGESPVLTTDMWPMYVCDHRGDVWMFSTEGTWSFSTDSLRWASHPPVPYGDPHLVAGYDIPRRQFLFWSPGVGLVFAWEPGETAMRRLDRSFNHRNQFGHAGVVHPENGTIYAFGGEGFWENTGILTRFDHMSHEWHIVPINGSVRFPEPRSGSLAALDPATQRIYLMSGTAFVGHRQDLSIKREVFNDFWVFDLREMYWQKKPVLGLPTGMSIDLETVGNMGNSFNAVLDSANALIWFPLRLSAGNSAITLYAYDIVGDAGALLPLRLGMVGQNNRLKFITYDAEEHRLLLFWNNTVGKENDVRIQVSGFKLPPADSVRAMIAQMHKQSKNQPMWVAAWVGGLLILLLVGANLAKWGRVKPSGRPEDRRTPPPVVDPTTDTAPAPASPEPAVATPRQGSPPALHLVFQGKPAILFMGENINASLGRHEFELFLWMVWQWKMGRPYVVTDVMEPLFWPGAGSPDYVRKMRNTTLKRLEEQLAETLGAWCGHRAWVVDRVLLDDRRKREYGVDLSGIDLSTDCDPFFDMVRRSASSLDVAAYNKTFAKGMDMGRLLEPCKGAWADAVRKEAREWTG